MNRGFVLLLVVSTLACEGMVDGVEEGAVQVKVDVPDFLAGLFPEDQECEAREDCRLDGEDCLAYYCAEQIGKCRYIQVPGCGVGSCETASDCDDELVCTNDICSAGGCYYQPIDELCKDQDDDTIDVCDMDLGCMHPTMPD